MSGERSELCINVREKYAEVSKYISKLRKLLILNRIQLWIHKFEQVYSPVGASLTTLILAFLLSQGLETLNLMSAFAAIPTLSTLIALTLVLNTQKRNPSRPDIVEAEDKSSKRISYEDIEALKKIYTDLLKVKRIYKAILVNCTS